MTTRTFVTFDADFPKDGQWDREGNPIVPGGRTIACTIAAAIQSAGGLVTNPVQHSFYGWSFEVSLGGLKAWCLLQFPGPWLLLLEQKRNRLAKLLRASPPVESCGVLQVLHRVLKADARFSGVQWFTRQEYQSGCNKGAGGPL